MARHYIQNQANEAPTPLPDDGVVVMSANKLDADQYSADDLDGVTESMFGSGNMSHASLQASQTDLLLNSQGGEVRGAADHAPSANEAGKIGGDRAIGGGGATADATSGAPRAYAPEEAHVMDTDRPIAQQDASDAGEGNYTHSAVGTASASATAVGGGGAPTRSEVLADGADGVSGDDGDDTPNEVPPIAPTPVVAKDGENGQDGAPGEGGGGDGGDTTIINEGDTINLGDTITNVTELVTNIENTINNVTETVTDITQIIDDSVTNILGDTDVNLTEIIEQITNITNELSETVITTITEITNFGDEITSFVKNVLTGNGSLDLHVGGEVLGLVNGVLDLSLISGEHSELLDVAPVTEALEGLQSVTDDLQGVLAQTVDMVSGLANGGDVVAAIGDLGGLIEQVVNSANGAVVETLDIVEGLTDHLTGSLLGDLSLTAQNGENVTEILGVDLEAEISPVDDIAEMIGDGVIGGLDPADVLGGGLLGGGETDNGAGDSDLVVDLDVLGTGLVDEVEVPLDPLEAVVGDIDIDLDAAIVSDLVDGVEALEPVAEMLGHVGDQLADGLGVADGLLGGGETDNGAGDSDLVVDLDVLGTGLVDELEVPLDPLEAVVGDIDIDLDANIADGLLGGGETDNGAGDSDLVVDIGLLGNEVADAVIDVSLDTADEAIGDIGLDIDEAVGLLGGASGGIGGLLAGDEEGDDGESWTESTITDGGGLFGDVAGGAGDLGDALPDPGGSVAEGLGALVIDSPVETGQSGGLFG